MPKLVNREEYRQRLLQESFELFAEIGYGNITMRQLAQRLGVSTGTLYHYFPSKEAIFLQLVTQLAQQDITNFLAQAESIPPDIRSRLQAIIDFIKTDLDYFAKQVLVGTDYYKHHAHSQHPLDPVFAEADRQTIAAIDEFLGINNQSIAEFIGTFINGLIWAQIYHPNLKTWDKQVSILIDMVELKVNSKL
jgi:AcrR family transcriptional regulator